MLPLGLEPIAGARNKEKTTSHSDYVVETVLVRDIFLYSVGLHTAKYLKTNKI